MNLVSVCAHYRKPKSMSDRKKKQNFFFFSDFPRLTIQKILVSLTMKNSKAAMIFFQNDAKWYVFKSIIINIYVYICYFIKQRQ